MVRMKTNIKPSDVYALAIAATAEKYTTNGVRLDTDELADVLGYLCDQRDLALYGEQRDEEDAAKAKAEQREDEEAADHVES